SLDDSAARRVTLPELFLAADGALRTAIDLARGLEVDAGVVAQKISQELPFLAVEAILARVVKAGGDRQQAHEKLREHAMLARGDRDPRVKFCALVAADPLFAKIARELDELMDPARLVGRAPEQVRRFLAREIAPVLERARAVPAFDDPLEV